VRLVLDALGLEESPTHAQPYRVKAEDEKRIRQALSRDPNRVIDDLMAILMADRRSRARRRRSVGHPNPSSSDIAGLSNEEWIGYLRKNYPRRVVRDLEGIQQSAEQAMHDHPPKRSIRRRRADDATMPVAHDRLSRYLTHAVVLAVSAALISHDPTPLVVLGMTGAVVGVGLLMSKEAARFAMAFSLRRRSRRGSVEIRLQLRAPSWDTAAGAGILRLASRVLPEDYRPEYLEEQFANLLATESRAEWIRYVVDLILGLPDIAKQFNAERKRQSIK